MAAGGPSARKRARTFEPSFDGTPDDEGHSKGGHSLRKRARIDYTQEQIDDHLTSAAAKSEAAAKSVITPSARGRKKKGTHDGSDQLELEDFNFTSSIPKRRRPEKSPAPTRAAAASSRRRKTNSNLKKSSTEISTYVDQPSGDEVQDTILVGVSMDGLQDSDDERSEISSFGESETRPSTSDGSDAGQAQAEPEPATPQPEVIPQIEQAVSLAPESELSIDKDLVPEPPIEKADIAPGDISLTLQPKEPDPPEQPHEAEEPVQEPTPDEKTGLPESTEQVSEKPAEQPPAGPEHVKNETEVKAEHEVQPDVESTPPKPNQDLVIQTSELPAISEPIVQPLDPIQSKTLALSPAPPAVDFKSTTVAAEPIRPRHLSKIPSRRALRALQRSAPPARLKSLEKIYKIPSPFGTEIRLTPYYDDEDVRHPGPYTEWVNPDKDKTDITPMPTPTPTPSPMEAIPRETTWDGHRPLKFGDFFKLYRQETKRRQVDGEPHISMLEYKKECARKFKAAQALAETGTSTPSLAESATKPARSFPKITAEQIHKRLLAPGASRSFEDTPQGSQAADSQQPTAAPSPTAAEEDEPQIDGDADGLVDSPEAEAPGRVKTGSPAKPVEVTKNPPRQYLFPKLRDPQEFTDSFEGWQKMEPAKLYSTVAAAVETLDVYQREYNELKKIVDDEETAKRRVANDKTIINWENRQKPDDPPLWRRHFDDAVKGPPTFEVRGARAPKPFTDDPVLEHQKEEDKIMAQAYGFKHNAHPTQVGRQNPEDQRWEMSENRLRERKKTEKAAELAEENVIEGKRMRKPRNFSDQSKEPSRAGTPTGVAPPALGRRPRRKLTAMNDDDVDDQDSAEAAEPAAEPHTRKRRGPRPKGHSSADPEEPVLDAPVDQVQTDDEDVQDKTRQKSVSTPARKRGRGFATQQPPTSVPIDFGESKAKRQRTAKNQPAPEITSSSFYSNPSVDSRPESRPSTASSAATDNTLEAAETAYSLRDKRKRNFLLENDPEPETRPRKRTRAAAPPRPDNAEPKKRGPKRKTTASHPAPAAQAPLLPPPPPLVIAPPAIPHPVGGLKAPTFFFNQGPPALAPAPGPFLHTFNASPSFTSGHLPPPAAPPVVKKPITKIKLTNNGSSSQASSRAATPANIAPNPNPKVPSKTSRSLKPVAPAEPGAKPTLKSAAAAEVEKPYAEMSKSEKMSWSMRRRWASGEMQGAVEKRRTTLANKKAEKASVPANGDPVAIAPGEAGSAATSATSAPGTPSGTPAPPVLMPTQAGPPTGQLALPVQPPAPQTLQQPQGLAPPQGLRGFAHPTTERPEDLNEWDYA